MPAHCQGPAIYYDGMTGAPHSVTVTIEASAIAIASASGAPLARWPDSGIEPLPAPEGRLRLGLAGGSSTARLDVRGPAFAEAVRASLGFGTPQYTRGLRRHRRLIIAWSAAAVAAVLVIGVTGLPAIAALLAPFVPTPWEIRIGAQAHELAEEQFTEPKPFLCGDEGVAERAGKAVFLDLVKRLETAANLPVPIEPFVIRTWVNNATAHPGGYVHINMGFIDDVESPDEFVGVVAHELGHVAHHDSLMATLHTAGLAYLFGLALGDVFGRGALVVAGQGLLNNRYTRTQEAAADAYAVLLMARLGADSHRFADYFERAMQREAGDVPPILRTHPSHAARIAAIRSAPRVSNPMPLLTEAQWQTLKQVCSRR